MSHSIQNFFDRLTINTDRWLIVGKGPTAERLRDLIPPDLMGYKFLTLNHAVRLAPGSAIAHIIDVEVLEDHLTVTALQYVGKLAMPWFPHIGQKPDKKQSLAVLAEKIPILRYLHKKNRLVWYNLSSSYPRYPAPYTVRMMREWTHDWICANYFSAEAAFDLLSRAGVKVIHTIGVDGGSARAPAFSDIPFNNPHGTYDAQFHNIEAMAAARGIDYKRL